MTKYQTLVSWFLFLGTAVLLGLSLFVWRSTVDLQNKIEESDRIAANRVTERLTIIEEKEPVLTEAEKKQILGALDDIEFMLDGLKAQLPVAPLPY